MWLSGVEAFADDKRPNFVLLIGDDHGWSETGTTGIRM
jgi:hypothetical protein